MDNFGNVEGRFIIGVDFSFHGASCAICCIDITDVFLSLTVGSKKGQIVQAEQFKFSTHRLKILAIYEIFS